jgi:hypothetical protein
MASPLWPWHGTRRQPAPYASSRSKPMPLPLDPTEAPVSLRGNFIKASAAELDRLAGEMRQADEDPTQRIEHMLALSQELVRLADTIRERSIVAALRQRKLTLKEIGRLAGLSAPQILKRARDANIDTSKGPTHPGRA